VVTSSFFLPLELGVDIIEKWSVILEHHV